ncbi:MAG TPA: prepilin-type N-terminal cleavage/methylation domain-containing protein, partial [Vicinamibacterales bacterium]
MTPRPARTSEGVTIVELMVAMAVTLVLSAAVFGAVSAVQSLAASQPEVSAMQQGLRTALHLLASELVNAGAGLDRTALAGPLVQVLPPIVPYRRGQVDDDGRSGVTFRPDVLSLVYVAGAAAQ